jgi:hypothetical protein
MMRRREIRMDVAAWKRLALVSERGLAKGRN